MTDNARMLIDVRSAPSFKMHDGRYYLDGHLNFNNVDQFNQKLITDVGLDAPVVFDFSGLDHSNSAVIALMIEWVKRAQTKQFDFKLTGISDRTFAIIQAAGLQPLFSDLIL